jgi:1,4-dihydroxy-2-naphthoate octaprenyltransferase
MITTPFVICLIGALLWLIFTKWQKIADVWVAEFGKWCFIIGLFWTLAPYAGKVAW